MASSLTNTLKNTHEFWCIEKCTKAFQEFKYQVVVVPSLAMSLGNKDYTVLANVPKKKMGSILAQGHNLVAHVSL